MTHPHIVYRTEWEKAASRYHQGKVIGQHQRSEANARAIGSVVRMFALHTANLGSINLQQPKWLCPQPQLSISSNS